MDKTTITTWIALLLLTFLAPLASLTHIINPKIFIVILMVLKFLGVAFQFMELKIAHLLWKLLVVFYLLIFVAFLLLL